MTALRSARLRARGGPLLGGLGLIVLGVLLALEQVGVVDVTAVLFAWWPLVLVVLGGWWLLVGPRWTGAIVAVVGALLLAGLHLELPLAPTELVVPAVLALVGAALVAGGLRLRGSQTASAVAASSAPPAAGAAGASVTALPGATAVFGDAHVVVAGPEAPGTVVRVPVTVAFGDVHVEVPAGWRVRDRSTTLLGDVTIPDDPDGATTSPLAELHGAVLLGDVTVRHATGAATGASARAHARRARDRERDRGDEQPRNGQSHRSTP